MTTTERAAQIWTVLVYAAYHRQTVSREVLGRLIGVSPTGISPFLEPIRQYCLRRELPPLTTIVGGGEVDHVLAMSLADLHDAQSAVFHHPWIDENISLPGDLEIPARPAAN